MPHLPWSQPHSSPRLHGSWTAWLHLLCRPLSRSTCLYRCLVRCSRARPGSCWLAWSSHSHTRCRSETDRDKNGALVKSLRACIEDGMETYLHVADCHFVGSSDVLSDEVEDLFNAEWNETMILALWELGTVGSPHGECLTWRCLSICKHCLVYSIQSISH